LFPTFEAIMIERYTRAPMGAIWSEENKFRLWMEVEVAACEAQAQLGRIPKAAAKVIRKKANFDVKRINELERVTDHDLIAFVSCMAEYVGPEGRYIHLGMTSTDVVDTAQALQLTQSADMLLDGMHELRGVLIRRARQHKHTPQIGRTHGIQAEPLTFGLKLALWVTELDRQIDRLKDARETIAVGMISGAVGTYSNIDPRVETIACKILKLKADPASNQTQSRDRHAHFMAVIAGVGASLEKWGTEIRNLQRTEIMEAEQFFAPGQKGSSAMPHKRNPMLAERVAGLARVLRGNALAAWENVALWHERDITHSSVERIIFADSCILLDYMLGKFTLLMDKLIVYPNNMLRNIHSSGGLVFSQRVLLTLTEAGMKRDDAYAVVQSNAMAVWNDRQNNGTGPDFLARLSADPQVTKYIKGAELAKAFDLKWFLRHVDVVFKRLKI
jgi:adenylosuccinate lyase